MKGRYRPLTDTERSNLADTLQALADELRKPHAGRTQALLGEMLAVGFPTKASGAATAFGNQVDEDGIPVEPDSSTEQAALEHNRSEAWAKDALKALRHTHIEATALLSALQGLAPHRAHKTAEDRSTAGTGEWKCATCKEHKPESARNGERCSACCKFLERNGYSKASMSKYRDMTSGIIDDTGVYHG